MKKIILSLFLAAFTLFSSANAQNLPKDAKEFIQKVSDDTLLIVASDKFSNTEKEEKLNKLFEEAVDISWMGKFVVTTYWKSATPAEQKEYSDAYKAFLVKSYVPKFKSYTNQKIEITGMQSQEGDEYMVTTEIISEGKPNVKVDYKVRKTDKGYKVFDIIAEGVSLITTQRSEFSSILSRNGISSLIEQLKQKSSQS